MKSNGYVLHEDSQRVVIATGFARKSANPKTGDMIQVWILPAAVNPLQAKELGLDSLVCGDCPLRNGTCYVNLGQAPLSVYKAWKRGKYPQLPSIAVFEGRSVRLGAYGDPAYIPLMIVRAIVNVAKSHTGYTHQWRNPVFQGLKQFVMASVESLAGMTEAHAMGWRTFRVSTDTDTMPSEIVCVNTTKGITCEQCGLCNGASSAKSIVIESHGKGAKRLAEVN